MVATLSEYMDAISDYGRRLTVELFRRIGMTGDPFPEHVVATKTKNKWFRGQSHDYPLLPKLYRKGSDYTNEQKVMQECRRKAISLSSVPSWREYDAWLFLMQHHGLSTRLLDWTESSGTALFFAVENWRKYKNNRKFSPVVWMVNPNALNFEEGGSILPGTAEDEYVRSPKSTDYLFGRGNLVGAFLGDDAVDEKTGELICREKPIAIAARYVHTRMQVQRSCFTVHGRRKEGFGELYVGCNLVQQGILAPIRIDPTKAERIVSELREFGISKTTLFPDLEGIAADLNESFADR